jgi:hypothetical protein
MSDKPLGSVQPGKEFRRANSPLPTCVSFTIDACPLTTPCLSLGDSKSTADKLTEDAKAVGQNILDTGKHYGDKTGATDTADKATAKAESIIQNIGETAQHYADKADDQVKTTTATGEKTYLETAQDVAANALNTVSKAASGRHRNPIIGFVEDQC